MRRSLSSLVAVLVLLAFASGPATAFALTPLHAERSGCALATPGCHDSAVVTCACCQTGKENSQAPALPSNDRTSVAKNLAHTPVVLPASAMTAPVPPRDPSGPSTRRAGPPISLSILHAALLL